MKISTYIIDVNFKGNKWRFKSGNAYKNLMMVVKCDDIDDDDNGDVDDDDDNDVVFN